MCALYLSCHVLCFVITERSGLSITEDRWLEKDGILKEYWIGFLLLLWSNLDILLTNITFNWSSL